MRLTLIVVMLLGLATEARTAHAGNTFVSDDYGMSIDAPAPQDMTAPNNQIVAFFLPSADNFTANINVLRETSDSSLEAYDKQTLSQFKQFKLTVLSRTLKGNELRYEYKGTMQGRFLHWYARAVKTGRQIYLVTATALDSQWDKQKPALMKSVESFSAKPHAKKK